MFRQAPPPSASSSSPPHESALFFSFGQLNSSMDIDFKKYFRDSRIYSSPEEWPSVGGTILRAVLFPEMAFVVIDWHGLVLSVIAFQSFPLASDAPNSFIATLFCLFLY